MHIGVVFPQTEFGNDPAAIRDYAQQAEALGYTHILAYDHVLGANPDPEAIGDDANPNWFKETEAYNDAIRWGTEMLRAQDLESYLKY